MTQPTEPAVQLPLRGFIGIFAECGLKSGGDIARRLRCGNEEVEMGFFFRNAFRHDPCQIFATQRLISHYQNLAHDAPLRCRRQFHWGQSLYSS